MKTYEKPTFTLVSLSTNTAFCSCGVDDDLISGIPGFFTEKDGCAFNEGNTDIYCKFGPSGGVVHYS